MRKHLWAISEALVPRKHFFDFNQALMDFGATVCTARKPKCAVCPMTKLCASYQDFENTAPE
jgi:A/G-specific adenine glycosylase